MRPIAVSDDTLSKLHEIANWSNSTIDDVLLTSIEEYYRKEFFAECDRGYERLRADPVAWQEELEERDLWDNAIGDGLEDD
jgi:predicted transcriptional regulator